MGWKIMKYVLAAVFGFILSGSISQRTFAKPFSDTAAVRTDTITVHDMRCGQCETRIHRAIKKVAGITDSYADAETGTVVVTYKPEAITRAQIEQIIVKTGYGVGKTLGDPVARKALPGCCR
jgi:copper chaperone CopZ